MRNYGAEIVLSTAAFWVSRAEFNAKLGEYEINDVIGPDEWHEHVDNNTFTNYMAKWNIQAALKSLHWLRSTDAEKAEQLAQQLELNEQQLDHWREVSSSMRILQDQQTGLFEQFEGFFKLEFLDQS